MNLKQKICALLFISSNLYVSGCNLTDSDDEQFADPVLASAHLVEIEGGLKSSSSSLDSRPELQTSSLSASEAESTSHIHIPYNHDDEYVHIIAFEFVGKRFNEKVGYDDLYYWECKVDKLLSIMHNGYSDIDESDIEEIRRNAPELYRKYRRQFEEYMAKRVEDKPLLFSESGFVLYIPEEIARGEKKQEHKEEVVIHLTSDPNLFDRVFRAVPIRERPKVSEASRIRREKQEAEYREQQRIHAEQYKAKERALRRANGEDMIFDPRVGKRVHFEDYLRSLFLSQPAETRARRIR